MNTTSQYDSISLRTSKNITKAYSTSFSLGIHCLGKQMHSAIYSIYGFVRLADEIVDTFHAFNQQELFLEFKRDTFKAISVGFSLNPVLNSFQYTVRKYAIDEKLIESFLQSMEWDLTIKKHNQQSYEQYIYGSAESVGLMCLKVFVSNNSGKYNELKESAKKLGAAFQKVNFLRDFKDDYENLGRNYFPELDFDTISISKKEAIEKEMEDDFRAALQGIKKLPLDCRFGVYVAYVYYRRLFSKLKSTPETKLVRSRIRVPNGEKAFLLILSWFRHKFDLI